MKLKWPKPTHFTKLSYLLKANLTCGRFHIFILNVSHQWTLKGRFFTHCNPTVDLRLSERLLQKICSSVVDNFWLMSFEIYKETLCLKLHRELLGSCGKIYRCSELTPDASIVEETEQVTHNGLFQPCWGESRDWSMVAAVSWVLLQPR